MAENIVAKPVIKKRIELVIESVDGPVFPQLFGTQDKDTFVSELKVLHDSKGRVSFSQPHAISKDTPIMGKNLIDGAFDTILLELEERFPISVSNRVVLPMSASVLPVSPRYLSKI